MVGHLSTSDSTTHWVVVCDLKWVHISIQANLYATVFPFHWICPIGLSDKLLCRVALVMISWDYNMVDVFFMATPMICDENVNRIMFTKIAYNWRMVKSSNTPRVTYMTFRIPIHQRRKLWNVYYWETEKLREGNVFTDICLFTRGR